MADFQSLLVDNDMEIKLTGVRDETTGLLVNDAVITATLYDQETGSQIGSALNIARVESSTGTYRGVIPGTTAITDGQLVRVEITTPDDSLNFEVIVRATKRG